MKPSPPTRHVIYIVPEILTTIILISRLERGIIDKLELVHWNGEIQNQRSRHFTSIIVITECKDINFIIHVHGYILYFGRRKFYSVLEDQFTLDSNSCSSDRRNEQYFGPPPSMSSKMEVKYLLQSISFRFDSTQCSSGHTVSLTYSPSPGLGSRRSSKSGTLIWDKGTFNVYI